MAMRPLQAVLWDVDGTLAETERDGHRVAFNQAFKALGLAWHWDVAYYGELLQITGGRERLLHDMASRSDGPRSADDRQELARALHVQKNAAYASIVESGAIPLREGVAQLMAQCLARGVRMGIATTSARANVDALLSRHLGAAWVQQFAAVVCGEDVVVKKPDPAVYTEALRQAGIDAASALAIEDSPAGVAAARGAGIAAIVTRSAYFEDAAVDGVLAIGPGLHTRAGWLPATVSHGRGDAPVGLDDIDGWRTAAAGRAGTGTGTQMPVR